MMLVCFPGLAHPINPITSSKRQSSRGFTADRLSCSRIVAYARSPEQCTEPSPNANIDYAHCRNEDNLTSHDIVSSLADSSAVERTGVANFLFCVPGRVCTEYFFPGDKSQGQVGP